MPTFCETALEKLVYTVSGRAETIAQQERLIHECYYHRNPEACEALKNLTKNLQENSRIMKNLLEDVKSCLPKEE
jgi:hypothetical protein